MSDETIITLPNGTRWKPATSSDIVHCESCGNAVDTPEEVLSYPHGTCPECGNGWTGSERRSTSITVTAPAAVKGIA